ncbi:MAG: hypothetical protein LBV15_00870 [Planctomycetota bacterium]|jgi:Tfp pilus assembly protein PilF|nr:hypothetical protein [Planctomycetota bacterium]
MLIEQKERSLLARIGFFLCRDDRLAEAERIFTGLADSAPEKDGAVAGLALCRIIMGRSDEAIELLDRRLRAGSPIAPSLTLYKLLALGMAGRLAEARSLREKMSLDGLKNEIQAADSLLDDFARREAK